MEITVRLFASLREHAGATSLPLTLPDGATVADALATLRERGLVPVAAQRALVAAVNREYAAPGTGLASGDELALLPPVSGGAGDGALRRARITAEPLDPAALERLVRDPRAGAVVVFCGTTRDVPALAYETYAEMAQPLLERIARAAIERHGLCAAAVEHRTGRVALAESSVVVAASAPHRAEAFAGARELIDELKANVPIWKAEQDEAGAATWVDGVVPPEAEPG